MGICESAHHGKALVSDNSKSCPSENTQKTEGENSNKLDAHSNPENKEENDCKSSINQGSENNKCPELAKYDRSMYCSGKRSEYSHFNNKTMSVFSSGQTEEEVIIRGEINKECKNKEEDFDNNSFMKLVKNNGGIIMKNEDINSNLCSSNGKQPIFDFGKENISEIKSKHTFPLNYNRNFGLNNLRGSGKNSNFIKNTKSEKNSNFMNNKLRDSNKINVSIHDGYPKIDSYLSVPKSDEPFPNIDELSTESPIS